ncbi:hypothetical protein BT63DRAFT_453311 [Microthyrium microscopicum]|uniref:MARVEL domain-containing protein n=1 Tax=Microthyrium microscopicum TaxID=703497 RepID=A0A6A6UGJ8_9PEZI|nr:hypothetical protein BT63DRAFT_453311 [Microthyrium microscopicum]
MSSPQNGYSVVPVQKVFLPLRIVQLILGVAVLGISAYHLSLYAAYDAGGLGLFAGLATIILVVYWFVSQSNTNLYNFWAIFAVEIFVLIMWLCTFALIASKVALLNSYTGYIGGSYGSGSSGSSSGTICYAGYCVNYKRSLAKRYVDPFSATIYAALALAVVNFILFGVTFTLYTINMFRHRATFTSSVQNGSKNENGQSMQYQASVQQYA